MKILVTGAAGFVARHLIRELESAGHEVCTVDRNKAADHGTRGTGRYLLDLCDRDRTRAMLSAVQPDAIAHLAGWSHVGKSWGDPAAVIRSNVEATVALYADANEVIQKPCRFLYVSSAEVYGWVSPDQLPINLETPVKPLSPYGLSKLMAEMALGMLATRAQVELVIARPFNHIGPGQHPDFACPSFARKIAEIELGHRHVMTHGNLAARRDFLDVRDVANAYRLMLEYGQHGDVYIVASGVSYSMEEIVHRLFAAAGLAPAMEADPALMRAADIPELVGDPSWLVERTGWAPRYDIDATLAEVLDEARTAARRSPL